MPRGRAGRQGLFVSAARLVHEAAIDGICTGCSTGCSIDVEENQDTVYRLKPRTNPHVNQWWMCDEGRYGYHHVHSDRRLTTVERRDGANPVILEWSQVVREIDERFRDAGRVAVVLSPHLMVEEAYLLAKYARQIDPRAVVALGPVPVVGEDETFKNGFTIRAEKCPNRRGVEEVVSHFMGRIATLEDVLGGIEAGETRALWVSGGYQQDWIDRGTAERLAAVACLVVQDLFPSPLSDRATYRLPGAAFAEREGSYVNHADRLQSVAWAIRPPAGVRVEGQFIGSCWPCPACIKPAGAGRSGPRNRRSFRRRRSIRSAVLGVDLKVTMLARAREWPSVRAHIELK